jgi:BREX protein BrxB
VSEIDDLVAAYERFVAHPWRPNIAGPQRVWMAVYGPQQERRLRHKVEEFAIATKHAGHGWHLRDLTEAFPTWLGAQEYVEAYFEDPDALSTEIPGFVDAVTAEVTDALEAADEDDVVAFLGAGALYPFCRVSDVIERVNASITGRMLIFFPGEYTNNVYRLLNARDGWNYMAVPITAT